jgi:hypothetical protein
MDKKGQRDWLRLLLTPQSFVGLLIAAFGLWALLSAPGTPHVKHVTVNIQAPSSQPVKPQKVSLSFLDASGLEQTQFVELKLPQDENARLEAIFSALRKLMVKDGVWPKGLGAPTVFTLELAGKHVAVLDFTLDKEVNVSVAQERNLLQSLRNTAQLGGMDSLRILENHQPSLTFLGHIALQPGLE